MIHFKTIGGKDSMSDQAPPVRPARRVTYARPWALVAGLGLLALVFGLALWRGRTPAPLPVDAPASQFSAGRAIALLGELLAEGRPHPVGSEANAGVRERIAGRLESLGYDVEIQETVVCRGWSGTRATCAPVQNVVTRLPGQAEGPAVMLMAHYDSVGAGPGAADDTAGVAAVLEIARILQAEGPRRNPVIFLLTDGEEVGLMGAQGFAEEHPWARDLGAVINLEARGTGGQSLLFETSDDNAWLVDAYASSVPHPSANSLSYEVYKTLPNDTDLTVFKDRGVAALNFAFIDRAQHYHTLLDSLENLDAGSVQHQGESVLAVARALADRDLDAGSARLAGNAAYIDFLGLGVIRWPAAWTLPLALAAILTTLACAIVAIRRGALTVGGLLLGVLAALLCLALAILLGMGLIWLIARFGHGSQPWYAFPLPTRLSLWAGALLSAGLVAGLLGRRAGLWGLGLGAWLLWAILAVVLSLTLPGVAVFPLVPGLFAALLVLLALVVGRWFAPADDVALAVAAAGGGMFFLPLALVLESAIGLGMSAAITLPLGMVAATLLPLLALPWERAGLRRAVTVVSAAVVAGAAVSALLMPPYSEASPQPLNLYYVAEAGGGQAQYVSVPRDDVTPPSLRRHFEDEPVAVFPWSSALYLAAATEPTGAEGPFLQILSEAQLGENRTVQLLLRSPRGAAAIDLRLPVSRLASISVDGQKLAVDHGATDGDYALVCYGLACDGLEVILELIGPEPVSVLVADSSLGLPAGGEALLRDRPATAVPYQMGDTTVLWRSVDL
jgi:hypothetical protein